MFPCDERCSLGAGLPPVMPHAHTREIKVARPEVCVRYKYICCAIGEVINKPTNYWYEIELNPNTQPQTIIGYDEDGEKLFVLYPEGSDTV